MFCNYSIARGKKLKLRLAGRYALGFTHQECPCLLHGTQSCVNTSNFLHQRFFLQSRDHSLFVNIHNWQEIKMPRIPSFPGRGLGQQKLKGQQGCSTPTLPQASSQKATEFCNRDLHTADTHVSLPLPTRQPELSRSHRVF